MNKPVVASNKSTDEVFNIFSELIQRVYKVKRRTGSITTLNADDLSTTILHFEILCSTLAKRFHQEPSFLYTKQIIEFALEGLGDPVLKGLWTNDDNLSISLLGYSFATVQKYSQGFGVKIAAYLWEKNVELEGAERIPRANPLTLKEYLRQNFGLSWGEIKVLLAYSGSENKGRKEIANELGISDNTIKTHRRSIMKKMGTKIMNDAVSIVKAFKP